MEDKRSVMFSFIFAFFHILFFTSKFLVWREREMNEQNRKKRSKKPKIIHNSPMLLSVTHGVLLHTWTLFPFLHPSRDKQATSFSMWAPLASPPTTQRQPISWSECEVIDQQTPQCTQQIHMNLQRRIMTDHTYLVADMIHYEQVDQLELFDIHRVQFHSQFKSKCHQGNLCAFYLDKFFVENISCIYHKCSLYYGEVHRLS